MTDYDKQADSDYGPFRFGTALGVGPTGVQGQLRGRSRSRPEERHLPYARHMGIEILTAATAAELVVAFDTWRETPANERYRVMDLRLDFTATDDYILLIIYSE